MKAINITNGGNDNVINPEDDADLQYRKQQLEKLQEEVIDIEEMGTGVSIMDLGLNEFRLDLLEYIKQNPDVEKTPAGMNAVVGATPDMPAGVIYILKNINKDTNINNMNRLHPFYMVYLKENGEIVCNHLQPKELLDKLRLACKGKAEVDKNLCTYFNKKTKDGRDMKQYSALLNQQRAMHAGGVGDENARSVARITVVGQFADRVQFSMLHLRPRHQFPVYLDLTTVVIPCGHPVPTEADNRIVFDNDTADFQTLSIAAVGSNLRNLHIHRIVFFDVHNPRPERAI